MTNPTSLRITQVAALAGLSVRGMQKLLQEGKAPPRREDGYYDCEAVGAWIVERVGGGTRTRLDLEQERAKLAHQQTLKTSLENAELQGELVRSEDVLQSWADHVANCRARLLSLPTKCGPRARVAETDEECADVIEAEVLEALAELATDGLPKATSARRARAARNVASAAEADGLRVGGPEPAIKRRKRGGTGSMAD